jgi:hypothetical protein
MMNKKINKYMCNKRFFLNLYIILIWLKSDRKRIKNNLENSWNNIKRIITNFKISLKSLILNYILAYLKV